MNHASRPPRMNTPLAKLSPRKEYSGLMKRSISPAPVHRNGQKKIRAAIIGVGNCASSLVQGVRFYREAREDQTVPGLMHVNLGGYHIRDIEFTAAFDI